MQRSGSRRTTMLWVGMLLLAIVSGACIRLVGNNQPFASSDHAELAAIVTFFYPRSIGSLVPSPSSSWVMMTNPHGVLPPLIALVWSTMLGLLGVHMNEFWWNVPFVALNLLAVPLAAALVRRLANPAAGMGAAVLVAVLPVFAALARSSGVSHIPLDATCQLATVLCFVRYYEQPDSRRGRIAGMVLAINLLVELFFPLLFVLIVGIGVLMTRAPQPGVLARLRLVRVRAFSPQVMALPLLVLCFNFVLLLANITGLTESGGLAARLMTGSDRRAGIYLADFVGNAAYVLGPGALMILVALGGWSLPALWRLEQRGLPLLWALIYLVPFVLFTRPQVYGYFLLGVLPLTLNAAIVISGWWRSDTRWRWLAGATALLVVGLLTLRMLSMIFGINTVAIAGTGQAQGGVFPDQGLKAAAWWVRTQTGTDALVFADGTFEPYQLAYYLHRPFLGVTDATSTDEAYRLLPHAEHTPTLYLVAPSNAALLAAYTPHMPHLDAIVRVANQPTILIYGSNDGSPEIIDAATANTSFDAQFGTAREMFALDD